MTDGPRENLSVVVPLFNEAPTLPELHRRINETLAAHQEEFEVIFVDDGSTDATWTILQQLHHDDVRVTAVRLQRRFGQGAALAAGFDHANGEIILALDGDLQHFPEDLPLLLDRLREGYDVVSGWRVRRADPWFTRQLPARLANRLMAWASGVPLHDFSTTLKAYRRSVLADLKLYGDLYRFIPVLAQAAGASVTEVPVRNAPRRYGRSRHAALANTKALFDILTVVFLSRFLTRPLHFFGLPGLMLLGAGGLAGLVAGIRWLAQGTVGWAPVWLILAALSAGTGLQLIAVGLLAELGSRIYFDSFARRPYAVREVKTRAPITDAVRSR